jgi:hypothetical protein
VFAKREVKAYTSEQLIRTIQQHEIAQTLWITVKDVSEVRRDVHTPAQPAIHKSDKPKVSNITAWSGTALQLSEATQIIAFVWIPAIERNDSPSESVVWTTKPNLRSYNEVAEAGLPIPSANKWRIW